MRFGYGHLYPIGFYELNPFPGCNQITVSNHSFIEEKYRGRGLGITMGRERLRNATSLGYDYLICTVIADNAPQLALMRKLEYTHLDSFLNRETGNVVHIYGKRLRGEETVVPRVVD